MASRRIYTVKQPFMSRLDQFEEGKQSLSIGLAVEALKHFKVYRCYLGGNKSTWYEIKTADALAFANENNSWWTSIHTGHKTAILPLYLFKRHKARIKKTMPVDEPITKVATQVALF